MDDWRSGCEAGFSCKLLDSRPHVTKRSFLSPRILLTVLFAEYRETHFTLGKLKGSHG